MSQTRIICEGCGFPQVYCRCKESEAVPTREVLVNAILSASSYQPMYNGRPSCPFCGEFVDSESTHDSRCIVVAIRASDDLT